MNSFFFYFLNIPNGALYSKEKLKINGELVSDYSEQEMLQTNVYSTSYTLP
jgi:hypothetical protein